jgi:hypothetical protein
MSSKALFGYLCFYGGVLGVDIHVRCTGRVNDFDQYCKYTIHNVCTVQDIQTGLLEY